LKLQLPKIYPITDRKISSLSQLDQVRLLTDGGASLIQLREKTANAGDFYRWACDAVRFARELGVRIIINDRVDIALASNADGVHLGQEDLSPVEARRLLGKGAIIGFSTHSVRQAIEAIDLPVDYVAIGPVFPTLSKDHPDSIVGLEGVRFVREAIGDFPLVAIGGIDSRTAGQVIAAGADSIALISDLLADPSEIVSRTRGLIDTVK